MADFKITRSDELMHYRTKGSKNGVRLYQNPDGSLTPLGERHYRDMYGYGEQNSGPSKTLAQLRRERLGQSGRSVSGEKQTNSVSSPVKVTGKSLFPDNRFLDPPTERVKIDEYAPYVRVTGKSLFSDPKKASSEYLAEVNYNSKKNEYPGQSGRSVVVTPNTRKDVKGAPQGKVFRDTSMGPTVFKRFADDPNEVREIGSRYASGPNFFGKYDSKKADLYEDPRNFQKTLGDKTAPMYKSREDVKEKLRSEYGNNIPRDQYEAYMVTPSKDDVYNENGAHVRFGTTSLNRKNEERIAQEKAEEKAAKEKAEKEKAESLSGRLQTAYNDASKWVVDRADDVKKGATDAYNRASDAAVKVGDAAKNAYNDASKWVVDRADDVKKGATDASKWALDRVNDAELAANKAYNNASKWVVDRADDVKKGATDAYNRASDAAVKVGDAAKNAYNDASKWVVDRADDVKKGATDAYNRASDAAVKVGDAAKNAYNDASKWVVDRADDARYAAEGAYNSAKNAVTDVVDRVKETYGPGVADVARVISELPKNLNDPHLKEGFDNSYNAVKEWVTTAADDVKNTASEAFDAGKKWVDQAAKDVGKFADSALSDVTKAVDDAKKGVTDAANSVGKAAQDGWNWVKGLFGGGNDQNKDNEEKKKNTRRAPSREFIDENIRSIRTRYEK